MDTVDHALAIYQNDRKQLQNLRKTKAELIEQRRAINEQLPLLDQNIDAARAKVRESRQAFVAAAGGDD